LKKTCTFLFLAAILFIGSCKKTTPDKETTTTSDYALATQEFVQLFTYLNEVAVNQKGITAGDTTKISYSVCPSDTLGGDTTHNSAGVYINALPYLKIGYSNCTGSDGKNRSGTIFCFFHAQYNLNNYKDTIFLVGYTVNGNTYSANTITFIRTGTNTFIFQILSGSCVTAGATITYNCNYAITLYNNNTPTNVNDDYISITGTANGLNREGRTYSATIVNPLIKYTNCAWISQGSVNLSPGGLYTRLVDFGNGACDDKVNLTIDGQTYNVVMGK
jgi:hypothetical protein